MIAIAGKSLGGVLGNRWEDQPVPDRIEVGGVVRPCPCHVSLTDSLGWQCGSWRDVLGRVYWLVTVVSSNPGWPPQTGTQAPMKIDSWGSPRSETVAAAAADSLDHKQTGVPPYLSSTVQLTEYSVWIHHVVNKICTHICP